MPRTRIESLDDARVRLYRNLRDADLARTNTHFIAEGRFIVERLLASECDVESVLAAERQVEQIAPLLPGDVPMYVADDALIRAIVGFDFHRGVLACGRRPATPKLDALLERATNDPSRPLTFVICPETNETENLGAVIRIGAGFGVDALLLGERCCDPFSRRAVRVSMGAAFTLPIRRSEDLMADVARLRDGWQVETIAAVCQPDATPLRDAQRPRRFAIMLGSEANGLPTHWVDRADHRVTIPMHLGADSLNVAVAAAVCLFHFGGDSPCE